MAKIQIKQVAKKFSTYQALDSIDLTIDDKEFLVLLGASGCGKTTLLRIVAGLEQATKGEVWIGDRRIDHLPPRSRGIAMVFQNYAVFPHLTVFNNIGFGLHMQKLPQTEVTKRVERTAEMMHIEQLLKRYSGELSGGQRQRVAVARALAMEPDVILMDEPLSNLDALLRLEMRAELKGVLAESNTTTIYVTHDQVEAMSLADRIAVMHFGNIVQASTPIDIYRNPKTDFVASFIGNPPMNFLKATNSGSSKWQVGGASFKGPSNALDHINFAIRPEDLSISSSGIQAKVKLIEPLGAHLLVSLNIENQPFKAVLDSDLQLKVGQTIHIKPIADRIRWFDSQTKEAIS